MQRYGQRGKKNPYHPHTVKGMSWICYHIYAYNGYTWGLSFHKFQSSNIAWPIRAEGCIVIVSISTTFKILTLEAALALPRLRQSVTLCYWLEVSSYR